jgi:hypothetical protein
MYVLLNVISNEVRNINLNQLDDSRSGFVSVFYPGHGTAAFAILNRPGF